MYSQRFPFFFAELLRRGLVFLTDDGFLAAALSTSDSEASTPLGAGAGGLRNSFKAATFRGWTVDLRKSTLMPAERALAAVSPVCSSSPSENPRAFLNLCLWATSRWTNASGAGESVKSINQSYAPIARLWRIVWSLLMAGWLGSTSMTSNHLLVPSSHT